MLGTHANPLALRRQLKYAHIHQIHPVRVSMWNTLEHELLVLLQLFLQKLQNVHFASIAVLKTLGTIVRASRSSFHLQPGGAFHENVQDL